MSIPEHAPPPQMEWPQKQPTTAYNKAAANTNTNAAVAARQAPARPQVTYQPAVDPHRHPVFNRDRTFVHHGATSASTSASSSSSPAARYMADAAAMWTRRQASGNWKDYRQGQLAANSYAAAGEYM